jgi:hypothetical protein
VFGLTHVPCEICGAPVPRDGAEGHVCDPERMADFQVARRREEIDRFESDLGVFLASPPGRFAIWCAARERALYRPPRAA